MQTATDAGRDDRTVVLSRHAQGPDTPRSRLTDFAEPPRYAQLEERMVQAARLRPGETLNLSINPMIGAAAPLLSEVVRLRQSYAAEDLHVLKERLAASLRLFEQRALASGLDSGEVMAARYALCTTVDEAVVTTPWGNAGDWSQLSLLSCFHNETFGGEKFFLLLERLSRNPAKHLALLELLYLCLALGFEGKYRVPPRGMLELEAIRDSLYRQLRQLRGDVPRELSPHWQGLDARPRRLVRLVPWWLVALFTLICLASLYGGFRLALEQQRDSLLQGYPGGPAVTAPAAAPPHA